LSKVQPAAVLPGPTRDVALEVLIHGPLSRRDLARRLDVSPATLTRVSAQLLELGILTEHEEPLDRLVGRPARPLDIVPEARHFVGMKLTETTLHAVLTDLRANPLSYRSRSLKDLHPATVAKDVADLVRELAGTAFAPSAVGISVGGQIVDHSIITRAPFLHWTGVPLGDLVTRQTGLPTVLDNDVLALTRAEHWFGDVRTLSRFALITVGVGVGYGLVIHNQVVDSPDAGVGLLGHHPLDPTGPLCPAGHRGCAEAMLSMPAIEAEASIAYRRRVLYDDVLSLARAQDPAAAAIVRRSSRALGRLVAAVANLTMAEHVIVTGEGIALAEVDRSALEEGIGTDRDPASSPVIVTIKPDSVSDWARGAAAIAIQHHVLDGMPRART